MRAAPTPASPAEEKALVAERRIAGIRLAVIVFNVLVYYGLLPEGQGIPWLAATISIVALTYGMVTVALEPYRWLPILRAALFTALTDGVLIVLWVLATGGFASPFHLLWFLSLVAVSFRYEWRATAFATGLYISSYLALLAFLGQLLPNAVDVLVRCMYIALSGSLGAMLAHDSARAFEVRHHLEAAVLEERRQRDAQEVERLREMDRFKSQFINAAAHELNTPLTPVQLQMRMLEMGGDEAMRKRSMAILRRGIDRMSRLVQDMLDVARLQGGRLALRRKPTDVMPLVQDVQLAYRDAAAAKGVSLEVDGPSELLADLDGDRVAQILDNLVSNALKFTPNGGRIRLHAEMNDDELRLSVADTGVGFTPAQHEAMFRPFSRPHAETISVVGSGLGLFISRGLAERHGGRLDGQSGGPGQGATFTVVLPRRADPQP